MARQNECGHTDRKHFAKGMCHSCYDKGWRQNNPERNRERQRKWGQHNAERKRAANAKWRRNNPERWRELNRNLKRQQLPTPTRSEPTQCELCAQPCTKNKVLCLDHCHDTSRFRGWLCSRCNRGIGLLGDSLPDLQRAVAYLQRTGEVDYRADDGIFGDC